MVPCIPAILNDNSPVSGNEPIPKSEVITGIFPTFTNFLKISLAPEEITPPPAKITGFLLSAIFFAACLTCLRLPLSVGLYPGRLISTLKFSSIKSVVISTGISIKTGPGLPVDAILKASFITLGKSSISFIR